MMKYKYARHMFWAIVALGPVFLISGFNYVVDPFGYFGTNRVGIYFSSEREYKANILRSTEYNAVVIGDSRIAYLDPKQTSDLGYTFINAGFAGADFREIYEMFKRVKLDEVELVVIGILYEALKFCEEKSAADSPGHWNFVRYAASWNQLSYSLEALNYWGRGVAPKYHTDGTRAIEYKILEDAKTGGEQNARYWKKIRAKRQSWQQDLDFKDECLDLLREIEELSSSYGFDLILMLLPYNTDIIRGADWAQWIAKNTHNLQRLAAITPDYVDFSNSEYSNPKYYWLHDPLHFLPDIGARMMEEAILRHRRMESKP